MKKIILLFCMLFLLGLANQVKAQDYQSAIGLRLGYPISASYKFFVSDGNAVELYAGFRGYTFYKYFNIGAMYQVHKNIEGVDGLYWYFGGGVSALFYSYDTGFLDDGDNLGIGINGVLGLDYKFDDAPINLSLDWMPTIYLTGYLSGFGGGLGALSARYTLN